MRHPLISAVLATTALILLSMLAPGRAAAAEIGFSLNEAQIIVDFYGDGPPVKRKGKGNKNKGKGVGNQGMPPGLAKQGKLPPGIAKRRLPADLVAQLPPPPRGFERVIVDNDILLVDIATQVVHDALTDVLH
ncbi:MAG: hypothetical protein JSU82_10605 [Rhodospirillales bacterium]|nr:MAG: hypothetical protein JSU82_10605 [Rhodospirillales bacterium]